MSTERDVASPRPWMATEDLYVRAGAKIIANCDCLTHDLSECEANAALIVRAVNSHDALLEAAKYVLTVENKNWPNYVRQEFAAFRAAILAAEGGET